MSRRGSRAAVVLLVLLGAPAAARAADAPEASAELVAAGERIYRLGVLPDGGRLAGTIGRDVIVAGRDAACASCHRRSGWGSSEGSTQAPPVNARTLFRPVGVGYPGTGRARTTGDGARPAYTRESLARAIRQGVGPNGGRLRAPMPRFALTGEAMAAVVAYLERLGDGGSPGVDGRTVHLATIVAGPVPAERRNALLGVLRAFERDVNADSRKEADRRRRGGWATRWRYDGYRKWRLSVWELGGGPETWSAQLEELYREDPVFAVVGGVGEGTWQPVHDFCESLGLPCFFPVTDQPGDGTGYYTVYFSRGAGLEGEAAARFVAHALPPRGTAVQVYRPGGRGEVAARAFRGAAGGSEGLTVADLPLPEGPVSPATLAATGREAPGALILWLDAEDLAALGGATPVGPGVKIVLPSWALASPLPGIVRAFPGRCLVPFPYALPGSPEADRGRALLWMRSRKVEVVDERVQTGALFAAAMVGEALRELRGRFSRDYLMETMEHMVDNAVMPTVYPRLTLAPGERFASTACTMVVVGADRDGGPKLTPVGGRMVL